MSPNATSATTIMPYVTTDQNSSNATASSSSRQRLVVTSSMKPTTNATPAIISPIKPTTNATPANTSLMKPTTNATPAIRVEDAITSPCTPNGWDIIVDMNGLRQIYPAAKAPEIYLGENSCKGTEFGNSVCFLQGLRECLTSEIVTESAVIYRNQLY